MKNVEPGANLELDEEEIMSHTKRIYNRRLKKAQRYDLEDPIYIKGIYISRVGFPLTWRSFICMGHCHMCKDHTKDQRLLRKKRSEQFRFDLKNELINKGIDEIYG